MEDHVKRAIIKLNAIIKLCNDEVRTNLDSLKDMYPNRFVRTKNLLIQFVCVQRGVWTAYISVVRDDRRPTLLYDAVESLDYNALKTVVRSQDAVNRVYGCGLETQKMYKEGIGFIYLELSLSPCDYIVENKIMYKNIAKTDDWFLGCFCEAHVLNMLPIPVEVKPTVEKLQDFATPCETRTEKHVRFVF